MKGVALILALALLALFVSPSMQDEAVGPPGTKAPATNAPDTNAPGTNAPGTNAPGTNAPGTNAPGTNAPGTNAPATNAPAEQEPNQATPTPAPQPTQPTQEEVQARQEQNLINSLLREQQELQRKFRNRNTIRCWQCDNARTNADCLKNGKVTRCRYNQGSCQNHVRVGHGKVRISKGCKQTRACWNNQRQNRRAAWLGLQCNMYGAQNIVCRCCCQYDKCNDKALYCRNQPERQQLRKYETEQYELEEEQEQEQPQQPTQEEVQERQQQERERQQQYANRGAHNNNNNNNNNQNNLVEEQPEQPTQEEIQAQQQALNENQGRSGGCPEHGNPCGNGGTCVDGANGSYTCQCPPGWGDSHCNTKLQ